MFHVPEHYPYLSERLSQVLDDIGVNETLVTKRRRAWVFAENIEHIRSRLDGFVLSVFHFGSQIEGSTTAGLKSDVDSLIYPMNVRVLQDMSEWEEPGGTVQFLMIQDETTSPGYCLLQKVINGVPISVPSVHCLVDDQYNTDSLGRLLLRHSICLKHIQDENMRHGPAQAGCLGGRVYYDIVSALPSSSWPKEAVLWLHQQNASGWPTEDIKTYSEKQGCFVVPVASKTGVYPDLEWRISTSLAERCLMININITQMRCYILMKMIVKTFITPKYGEAISSFMCKNILFQCIAESEAINSWTKGSLVKWLNKCLQVLYNCIITENCPHFIIPGNNLLAGKLSADVKHQLSDIICSLTENIEQSLLGIEIDDLGYRLQLKTGRHGGISGVQLASSYHIKLGVVYINITVVVAFFAKMIHYIMKNLSENAASVHQILKRYISKLTYLHLYGTSLEQLDCSCFTPFIYSLIGSTKASVDLQHSRVLSQEALEWFYLGVNTDVSSGRLKLASAFYCTGELKRCLAILLVLRRQLEQSTVQICCVCQESTFTFCEEFLKICYESKEEDVIRNNSTFCVKYLPSEIFCVPREIKYEMFRSTQKDRGYRSKFDYWMD